MTRLIPYADRRLWLILLLGFSSGLPLALTGSTLQVWLRESGVDLTSIGLFALVGLPYSLKFVVAPFLDRIAPPLMGLGVRRGWGLFIQGALALALIGLGTTGPEALAAMALMALLVAFLSACQDIVIDAWRIEILEPRLQAAGSAMVVLGYRGGMLMSGAGALALAEAWPWARVYLAMAAALAVGATALLIAREPLRDRPATAWPGFADLIVAPFRRFMLWRLWPALLALILLFKLGDVLLGHMASPFYVDMGFTKTEIAAVVKGFGLAATLIGTIIGGAVVAWAGLARGLILAAVVQALSNLAFIWLATAPGSLVVLTAAIAIENLAGGLGTAALVGYLSALCDRGHAGTQYALLTSFMGMGRDVIGAASGALAQGLGWIPFFLVSMAAALPGLALALWLARRRALPGQEDKPGPEDKPAQPAAVA